MLFLSKVLTDICILYMALPHYQNTLQSMCHNVKTICNTHIACTGYNFNPLTGNGILLWYFTLSIMPDNFALTAS